MNPGGFEWLLVGYNANNSGYIWLYDGIIYRYNWYNITGWWLSHQPLWKMMDFVSWDYDIPNWTESHKKMFQTTNQIIMGTW